ncbi:transporter substrate-binding domain-containing protein [Chachezhania antarctica]|uniref:transporter substrate-binding domain-containing protein n=1 Tax=Chachezhania antarctica TaxID=2340860 RepID=UPI000EAFFF16|nr:transporter substrate-binding domain-containing protein [Chachezhania antarctica]|tara:strand:- start:5383 stop:6453 length:1071 start_codon:yes stop_codon:yes gene_type:complete
MFAALLIAVAGLASPVAAQEAEQTEPLRIAVHDSPPFVMIENGQNSGLAIDLWEKVARELGYQFEYQEFETIRSMIDATAAAEVDVAVTNLTVTEARAERIDFSQPWYDSGLRIMVSDDRGSTLQKLFVGLRDSGFLRAYAWLAFALLVASLAFTFFDRKYDKDFPEKFQDGFAESFYTVMTVATSGKPPKRKNLFGWLGRMWQGLWLVCGVMVVAFVTSTVTSVMTTLSIKNDIRSVMDLPGLYVGVSEGSSAEEFAEANGITTISFSGIRASTQALLNGEIQAIIGDKPVLEYYTKRNSDQPLTVVGAVFNPEKYAFALPQGSDLRKPITVEIVGARQDGEVQDMATRYFGLNP